MGFYIEEIPTEFNGITMGEADYLADEFLKDAPCNRMWDAMRALRDFYETVISGAVEVKNTADTSQTDCEACELDGKVDVCRICRVSNYEPQPDCPWR